MKLNIKVDNKNYEVEVEVADPATAPIATHMDTGAPVDEAKVCRSPVSGIVVRLTSQVGQKIQSGDTLLVLEAMKMETNITAPSAGKIVRINVAQGDAVQGGMVLVEFE
jgi:methylmalonyl-CoA carboxyltransferase small subunit